MPSIYAESRLQTSCPPAAIVAQVERVMLDSIAEDDQGDVCCERTAPRRILASLRWRSTWAPQGVVLVGVGEISASPNIGFREEHLKVTLQRSSCVREPVAEMERVLEECV